MALVLTRCKFLATYDPVNNNFIVGDAYEGAVGLSTALLNAGVTDLAGAEAYFTVQYRDRSPTQEPSKRAAFEVGIFERLANGRLKLKGALETSSNGNSPVAWSSGVRELVMQSTFVGSKINEISVPPRESILSLPVTGSIAANTTNSGLLLPVTSAVEFEPRRSTSKVFVSLSSYVDINYTSPTSLGGRIYLQAFNGSTWATRQCAYLLIAGGDGRTFLRHQGAFVPLEIPERDAGKVKVRVGIDLTYNNLSMSISSPVVHFRESYV